MDRGLQIKDKMKITMEFNLPEEKDEFKLALDGSNLSCAVEDFAHFLRSIYKYETMPEDMLTELEIDSSKITEEQKTLIANLSYYLRGKMYDLIRESLE